MDKYPCAVCIRRCLLFVCLFVFQILSSYLVWGSVAIQHAEVRSSFQKTINAMNDQKIAASKLRNCIHRNLVIRSNLVACSRIDLNI